MRVKTLLTLAVGCAVAALIAGSLVSRVAAQPDARADARGHWITQSGNLEVDIEPCDAALCGTVVRVLGNRSMSRSGGEMHPVDTRPALGMKILTDFTTADQHEWKGQIYNRENGNTYDCRLSLESTDRLRIRAYRFLPLFGKTQIWTRVAATAAQ